LWLKNIYEFKATLIYLICEETTKEKL